MGTTLVKEMIFDKSKVSLLFIICLRWEVGFFLPVVSKIMVHIEELSISFSVL